MSLGLDYVASIYGAKRFGATWRGAVGAIVGGLVGLFFALSGNSALNDYNALVNKSISGQPVDGSLLKKKQQTVRDDYQYANIAFITGGVLVADEVAITLELELLRSYSSS